MGLLLCCLEVCESYVGKLCRDLPGYDQHASVYINRHELKWTSTGQTSAEVWMLNEFINIFPSKFDIPESCLAGIKEMICHSTLPLCHTTSGGTHMILINALNPVIPR